MFPLFKRIPFALKALPKLVAPTFMISEIKLFLMIMPEGAVPRLIPCAGPPPVFLFVTPMIILAETIPEPVAVLILIPPAAVVADIFSTREILLLDMLNVPVMVLTDMPDARLFPVLLTTPEMVLPVIAIVPGIFAFNSMAAMEAVT